MVVSGVRSSCEASAANCRTLCSELSRAPNACWIRSSMVLIAVPSLPTSVLVSASGIRAVRSPWVVIRWAVPAISLSGASPRPMSQRPPRARSRISAPPVINSATTMPPTWPVTTPTGRATTTTANRRPQPRRGAGDHERGAPDIATEVTVGDCPLDGRDQFRRGPGAAGQRPDGRPEAGDLHGHIVARVALDLGRRPGRGRYQPVVELGAEPLAQHERGHPAHHEQEGRGDRDQHDEESGAQRQAPGAFHPGCPGPGCAGPAAGPPPPGSGTRRL